MLIFHAWKKRNDNNTTCLTLFGVCVYKKIWRPSIRMKVMIERINRGEPILQRVKIN